MYFPEKKNIWIIFFPLITLKTYAFYPDLKKQEKAASISFDVFVL